MSGGVVIHRRAFVGNLFISMLLTACAGESVGNRNERNPLTLEVGGTVQEWVGKRATVRAVAGDYGRVYRDVPLAEGVLEADGSFLLTLPSADEIPDEVFYPAKSLFSCIKGIPGGHQGETGSVEVVPEALNYVYLEAFAVFLPDTDANREGDIFYSTYDADTNTGQDIVYLYATTDGTVKGRCTTSVGENQDGYDASDSYDLTLKAGWNKVIATDTSSLRGVTLSLTTGPLPEGLTWQYLDYSSFPKDGPPEP